MLSLFPFLLQQMQQCATSQWKLQSTHTSAPAKEALATLKNIVNPFIVCILTLLEQYALAHPSLLGLSLRAGHRHHRYGLYGDGCTGAIYHTLRLEGNFLTVWVTDCKPTVQDLSVHGRYGRHTVVQNKIHFDAMISATPRNSKP